MLKFVPTTTWPALGVAGVLACALAANSTLDSHEVLVAQTAREMQRSGDWVNPTFGGEPRWQKPPLAYWCAATSFLMCGSDGEIPARLPAALATVLGVLAVGELGRRAWGAPYGWLAGALHASMFWVVGYGRLAIVDASLATLTTLAILCAGFGVLYGSRSWWSTLGFWTSAGLLVLAKGPVGVLIVAPAVVWMWIRRRPILVSRRALSVSDGRIASCTHVADAQGSHWLIQKLRVDSVLQACSSRGGLNMPHILGILVFSVLAFAWPIAVAWSHPEAVEVWNAQSVGRFQEHWGPQTRQWYYYFYTVPWLTLPWFPLAVLGAVAPLDPKSARTRRVLLIWFAAAFLLCTLSAGKREHYILPGLPPLSLLAALGLRRLADWRPTWRLQDHRLQRAFVAVLLLQGIGLYLVKKLRDRGADVRALVAAHRATLQSAERIVQLGDRERILVYYVDRPVAWLSDPAEFRVGDVSIGDRSRLADSLKSLVVEPLAPPTGRTVALRIVAAPAVAERTK